MVGAKVGEGFRKIYVATLEFQLAAGAHKVFKVALSRRKTAQLSPNKQIPQFHFKS